MKAGAKLAVIILVPGGLLLGAYWLIEHMLKPAPVVMDKPQPKPTHYCADCDMDVPLNLHLHCMQCDGTAVAQFATFNRKEDQ